MSSLASTPLTLGVGGGFRERIKEEACSSLRLRPMQDGWSLVAPDGELVFHAPGLRGRLRCLRFARAHGILTIVS